MKYYVYHVWQGVAPTLFGPYNTEIAREAKAAELVREDPELDNEIFWMDVNSESEIETGAYTGKWASDILNESQRS